jgi:arylsulfatase A-like enzyme
LTSVFLIVIAALVLLALLLFIFPRSSSQRPNVLWITLDSCRYDHLGCYGYERAQTPVMDAIAEEGVAFSQAIAQASATRYSVPSMVTGRYPLRVPSRSFAFKPPEEHSTVAELLQSRGYRSCVITDEHPVLFSARGFEQVLRTRKNPAERTAVCLQTIDEFDQDPFFIWLYYWDPHIPYSPPERFVRLFEPTPLKQLDPPKQRPPVRSRRRVPIRDENGLLRTELIVMKRINFVRDVVPTELDRQHLLNLYDAEIAFVDEQIGRVVEKLKQKGLWENTLVLVTSDHGESFGEHERYYHGLNLYDEVLRVPLIIKPPRSLQAGRLTAAPVRNVDIVPTILHLCGAAIPDGLDGNSLHPFLRGENGPGFPAYSEIYYQERGFREHFLMAFRTSEHKLIYDMLAETAQLYDLEADPGERHNLMEPPPQSQGEFSSDDLELSLRQAFLAHLGLSSLEELSGKKLMKKMDPESEEKLRALGYIE